MPVDEPGPRLFSLDDVADRLHVSRTTVNRLIQNGTLRSVKLGEGKTSRRLVSERALDDFISEHED